MSTATAPAREGRPRRISRRAGVIAVAAIVGAAASFYWLTRETSSAGEATGTKTPAATAEIARRDLVETQSFEGLLGYADETSLTSSLTGSITWMPEEGSIVRRGEALARIDGRAVRLLYGNVPGYRTMSLGMTDGADVLQLERNLVKLGYDSDGDIEVDREFDSDTRAAVQRWEDDLGITEDGVIELGEVAFLPGARRVGAHAFEPGATAGPGAQIMSITSSSRIVELDVPVSDADLFTKGRRADVELPDGTVASGRISIVGATAEVAAETEGGDTEPTVPVEVTLKDVDAGSLDRAPVDVEVTVDQVKDALSVPISALLALAEGGYAVEIVADGTTSLVAVEPGKYADGWVEVSGDGLAEGNEVVVPE